MTDEHIKRLIEYSKNNSQLITRKVLHAIAQLGNPQPKDIKKYLDDKTRQEVLQSRYHNGKISSTEIEKEIKKRTVSIRTVQRKLAELVKIEIIGHADNRYYIAPNFKNDYRFFAYLYGTNIFLYLGQKFSYSNDRSENFLEAVKEFGVFVAYMFLKYFEPQYTSNRYSFISKIDGRKMIPLTLEDKNKYQEDWLSNAIPLNAMLMFFAGPILGLINPKNKTADGNFSAALDEELSPAEYEHYTNLLKKNYQDIYSKLTEPEPEFFRYFNKAMLSAQKDKEQLKERF